MCSIRWSVGESPLVHVFNSHFSGAYCLYPERWQNPAKKRAGILQILAAADTPVEAPVVLSSHTIPVSWWSQGPRWKPYYDFNLVSTPRNIACVTFGKSYLTSYFSLHLSSLCREKILGWKKMQWANKTSKNRQIPTAWFPVQLKTLSFISPNPDLFLKAVELAIMCLQNLPG